MKNNQLRIFAGMLLLWLTTFGQVAKAQVEKVDYLLLVDVSGEYNIYLKGIQHAIDTFYVAATKRDALRVYNFAKTVATKDDVVDADFYQYSDLGCMLQVLDSLIKHSNSRYVRAFILSDFFNEDPVGGDARLNPVLYSAVRDDLEAVCRTKNVEISLMLLPPSSNYNGYSIEEVKSLLPIDRTETFSVSPDQRTIDYLMHKVEAVNRLRGLSDEPVEQHSPIASYIILGLFLVALLGLAAYLKWK